MTVKRMGEQQAGKRNDQIVGLQVEIEGAVQGVGFRPFVYRLATELNLTGWVNNSAQGVCIKVEGPESKLECFVERLELECPPHALIQNLTQSAIELADFEVFEIRQSDSGGKKTAYVLPDLATCKDCLQEIFDPGDRRYRYPFTNCTNCGPRFSIIKSLPYDRPNTTMREFVMCDFCQAEYVDPLDRRFHAQPNACRTCGPQLEILATNGKVLAERDGALKAAAEAIRSGQVVVLKGLGGFQLIVDARNSEAVIRLRKRKHREEKPLAIMADSLDWVRSNCELSSEELDLLDSPESPIVLLRNKRTGELAEEVAPGNPYLGVMMPYTPLHHLLLAELGFPIVATSGNLSDEPICISTDDALERLEGIADIFLTHNRPIERHVDDSVIRMMAGRPTMIRRARGYAPLPITLQEPLPQILAVGAHLKNTFAISSGRDVFVGQHIGDLETELARAAFGKGIADFEDLYESAPECVVSDAHPDYHSTRYAASREKPLHKVQHHLAHVLSCMAENDLKPPLFGISWDGTGYGFDGTIWGGEFFHIYEDSFERVATLRQFRLPGGEKSVVEPRRTALGLLYEIYGKSLFEKIDLPLLDSFSKEELDVIHAMLRNKLNSPLTSSMGRLFDAIAALIGLRQKMSFEGQAAMELECALADSKLDDKYSYAIINSISGDCDGAKWIVDWEPMIGELVDDLENNMGKEKIAARFHNMLVDVILDLAHRVGERAVVLSGGCFQNLALTERAVQRLRDDGFEPSWHHQVPPNDGGIALGQIVAVAHGYEQRS